MKRTTVMVICGCLILVGALAFLVKQTDEPTYEEHVRRELECVERVIEHADAAGRESLKGHTVYHELMPGLRGFLAQCELLESEVVQKTDAGVRAVRLYRAPSYRHKYPLIRVEGVWQNQQFNSKLIQGVAMVADHILVKLKKGMTEQDLRAINKKHGATIRRRIRGTSGLYIVSFFEPAMDTVPDAIGDYKRELAAVSYAEADYVVFASATPSDTSYSTLYGMHNTGQTGGTDDADIDAAEAWDLGTGSKDVLVGVIDTGIDYDHEDLAANMWTNPGEIPANGIDDDGNGYIDDVRGWNFINDTNNSDDDHYHGTHCAGTIGAVGNNSKGVVGVCWNVSMVGLKFLNSGGSGYISDAVDATYYATTIGCNLTSNSWGGGGFSQSMKDAIDDADANGILFIAAAGNSAADNDVVPHYPSTYTSPNVIAVAATDDDDARAYFSCYGLTSVDVAAPGVSVNSCRPNDTYGYLSGTSMATPHVAGLCALFWSMSPGTSHSDLKSQLMATVDLIPAMDGKCVSGGRINARTLLGMARDPKYVDASATGANNGSSWADAFTDLQTALATTTEGDQLWVAAGTYKPANDGDRTKSFVVRTGVLLYGGFAGNETRRSDRDPVLNPTILSGDLIGNDAADFSNRGDNSYHVLTATAVGASSVLDGFLIRGGHADGGGTNSQGAGLYCYASGNLRLNNCVFRGNYALVKGGALFCESSAPEVEDCTFTANKSATGGGVTVAANSTMLLKNCVFIANTATSSGGAVAVPNASPTITGCRFRNNAAPNGAGIACSIGGVPTIAGCTFVGNTAGANGAAIHCDAVNASIGASTFHGNKAIGGGALYNTAASPTVSGCLFAGNKATDKGGAVRNELGSLPTLTNCVISKNAAGEGGAVYSSAASAAILINCTIARNRSAGTTGGVYNHASNAVITNCIIWGNSGDGIRDVSATPIVTHSCIQGGYGYGTSIVDDNPGFADPIAGDYHLTTGSPCINTGKIAGGVPSTDHEGNSRDVKPDIGAFEFVRTVHYVDRDATGRRDGSSWADAFVELTDALSLASEGDEIWVAEGSYRPTNIGDRTAAFVLKSGIKVYGGFNGTETAVDQRDWVANVTILTGDLSGDDLADGTYNDENSYHVVYASNVAASCILDGFTITGGNANAVYPDYRGAGLYCLNSGSPTVRNCTFSRNRAPSGYGGAVYAYFNAAPAFENCVVDENAGRYGGAMSFHGATVTLDGCTFRNNSGANGGIMQVSSTTVTAIDCTFENNTTTYGGIYSFTASTITLRGCTFDGNEGSMGTTIYGSNFVLTVTDSDFVNNNATSSGVTYLYNADDAVFTNCRFSGNSANTFGSAVYVNSAAVFRGCTFDSNSCNYGTIFAAGGEPVFRSSTFTGNTGNIYGGALYAISDSTARFSDCVFEGNIGGSGAAVRTSSASPSFRNCTFTDNSAGYRGGALYADGTGSPVVKNCILWGNSAVGGNSEIYVSGSTPVVTYSCIEGGYTGTGNIDADPLFAGVDDFHLQSSSPCVDAGISGSDIAELDKEDRIRDAQPDMGAFEYGAAPNAAPNAVVVASAPSNVVGTTVTLSAAGSSDPDSAPDPITYSWAFVSGPAAPSLNNDSGTWSTASFVAATAGTYVFELTVSDGELSDRATAQITIGDYLQITLANSASETAGSVGGSVTIARSVADDLLVSLGSSNINEAEVPATVTIPAGSTSVPFTVTVHDDSIQDGNQAVTISAEATGWISAQASLSVLDNECEIDLQGNGTSIADGDTTPSTTDHTDFGVATLVGEQIARTFTVKNTGSGALVLTGSPRVAISGTHAAEFAVTAQPAASIAGGDSSTFVVTFTAATAGTRNATVSISNNDSDESPYSFAIAATFDSVPEINVKGNGQNISSGDTTPSTDDYTDFGTIGVGGPTQTRTYSIENLGNGTLNLTGSPRVGISGTHAADFSVTSAPAGTVASEGSDSFGITFNPSNVGDRVATITIDNDDPDESSYTFSIKGYATTLAPVSVPEADDDSVLTGDTVMLTGSNSYDPDDAPVTPLTYSWAYVSGPESPGPTLTDASGDWMDAMFVPSTQGVYVFSLTVSDGAAIDTEEVRVYVGNSLILDVPASVLESGGTITAHLRTARVLGSGESLTVSLSSSDTSLAEVATTVTISASRDSAPFTLTVHDDTDDNGDRPVTIEATATDWKTDRVTIVVMDDEAAEINLVGNGNSIASGDTTPRTEDYTDFGSVPVTAGDVNRTFVIENSGTGALALTGSPRVSIGGAHASDFSVPVQPSASVATGDTSAFTISFNPTAGGTRTATVTIANDDADEGTYTFGLAGYGTVPEIDVYGNGNIIADGTTVTSPVNKTDFGTVAVSTETVVHTFSIENTGDADLSLNGIPRVTITGTHASDFTVTAQPTASVAPGGNSNFVLAFDPSSSGIRTATVQISSDDADEETYTFAIQGEGSGPSTPGSGGGGGGGGGCTTGVPSASFHLIFLAIGALALFKKKD